MFILQNFIIVVHALSIIKLDFRSRTPDIIADTNTLSNSEVKALEQLRKQCSDIFVNEYERTDEFLLNWIREYNMDVNAACEMITEARRWRNKHGVDSIRNETIILKLNALACHIGSVDDEGKLYLVCQIATVDARKLILDGHRKDLIRFGAHWLERFLSEGRGISKKLGTPYKPGIIITDVQGFNIKNHACIACIGMMREILFSTYKYYPRIAKPLIFINLPRMAVPMMNILKPSLGSYYNKNMVAFGTNKTEWSSFLLSNIPADRLPVRYGGKKLVKGFL